MTEKARDVLLAIAFAAFVGAFVAWHHVYQREALLIAAAVLMPLPLVVRAAQRRFDPFEPIAFIAVAATLLFVARPLAHVLTGDMSFRMRSLEPTFDKTLLVVIVGMAAVYLGYAVTAGRSAARRTPALPDDWDSGTAVVFAVALVLTGVGLLLAFLFSSGGAGAARTLLFTRSADTSATFASASAYFYFAPFMAIPAALIVMEASARSRRKTLLIAAAVCAVIVALLTIPRGTRIWLLGMVASILVLPYLRQMRRPRTLSIIAVVVLVFGIGVTFLRESRVAEIRGMSRVDVLTDALVHPLAGLEDFILGADTEMFAILDFTLQEVPSEMPHDPGITLTSLAAHPIPRTIWPQKPEAADARIYAHLFPEQAARIRAGTASSVFGGLWLDSAFIGVIFGGLLFGIACRFLYAYLLRYPRNASVRMFYAASLPLTLMLLRGNPVDTLARAAFLVVPIFLCVWFSSPRRAWLRRPKGPRESAPVATAAPMAPRR